MSLAQLAPVAGGIQIWIGNIATTVGGCGNLQMGGKYESNKETSYVNVSNSTR